MTKKWIYEGKVRAPKRGEHFIYDGGADVDDLNVPFGRVVQANRDHSEAFSIVCPIPDDVVMVPREKIEALRKDRWCQPVASGGLRYQLPSAYHAAIDSILACAEPEKPKDEILEALRRCRNTLNRDRINCTTDIIQVTDEAIALREKELKDRDA